MAEDAGDWGVAPSDHGNDSASVAHDNAEGNGEAASTYVAAVPNKDEDVKKARAAGWTETTATDYNERPETHGAWLANAARYEWSDDYGDVGPEVPELEDILFGNQFTLREGQHRDQLDMPVSVEGPEDVMPIRAFADAGLHPVILKNVALCKYTAPTPIQCYAIPALALGHDVVATAQTGSGKTAAYLIPILSKLMGKAKKLRAPRPDTTRPEYDSRLHRARGEPLVLIIVPTRELALQVFDELRRLCYRSMLRPCVAYGGMPSGDCIQDIMKGCDILVGTPGRLCDLMSKPDVLTLSRVKFTVIDEADEMLTSDWEEELRMLMAGGDTNEDADHQYIMFSATFPKRSRQMATEYMADDFILMRVGRFGQSHKNIRQNIIYVDHDAKRQAAYDLLFKCKPARTIIFCNAKPVVDLLDDYLFNRGLPTTSIHSDRTQREREDAIRAIRTGKAPILIATGVSSRGLDIHDVQHVINYDLPSSLHGGINEYIHRIGRTARMGHQGLATSFYNDRNDDIAQELVNNLVECECEIPAFLSHLQPEDGKLIWEDEQDEEAPGGGASGVALDSAGGGAGWGSNDDGAQDAPPVADGW